MVRMNNRKGAFYFHFTEIEGNTTFANLRINESA